LRYDRKKPAESTAKAASEPSKAAAARGRVAPGSSAITAKAASSKRAVVREEELEDKRLEENVECLADCETGGEEHLLPPADANEELPQPVVSKAPARSPLVNKTAGAARTARSVIQQVQHRAATPALQRKPQAAATAPQAGLDADEPAPAPQPSVSGSKGRGPSSAARPARPQINKPIMQVHANGARPVVKAAPARTAPLPPNRPVEKAAALPVAIESAEGSNVPMVSLQWAPKGEVSVGQECTCGLLVKNTGKLAAKDIVVEAFFPKSVRLLDAEPYPTDSKDHLVWVFEHLAPGEEKSIEIKMIPGKRGELATNATVRFTGVASATLKVEEPRLSLELAGANEALVGETVTKIIKVGNPGTGVAHDVVVLATLPQALENPRGKLVEMGIGSLGPGEVRELRLPLTAIAGGESAVSIEARAGSSLVKQAQCKIKVAAPQLKLEVAGPSLRFVNRNARYTVNVTNEGVAATDNVRVVHLIPEGFEFNKAERGGKFDAASGSVTWFLGHLDAGQTLQVSVELAARKSGTYQHHVQASGDNGTVASASMATKVDAAASLVMEVKDLDDPVEVGAATAYEIKIKNSGSKAAQNLKLVCELPADVELIEATGPVGHNLEDGAVAFKPIAELGPGAQLVCRVQLTATKAGHMRLRARLTSSAAPEPLIVEELTKFYAD
jgi:hypothetical protein